jgi:hypothetical protein
MLKLPHTIAAGYGAHLGAIIQGLFHKSETSIKHFTIIDLIHSLLEPHHCVLGHEPINALRKIQHARLRLLRVVGIVGDENQSSFLDGVDERRDQFQQPRCTDQAHEVVRLCDSDGFLDGHVCATAAGDHIGV